MPTFEQLEKEAIEILDSEIVMPIDEIRLGTAFSELPQPEEVAQRLIKTLFQHNNFHIRRVAVQAWRRIANLDVSGLREVLLQALEDPEGWVRYDAAWAIRSIGYKDKTIMHSLAKLADGAVYPDHREELEASLSDSNNRARLEAAHAIYELNESSDA